MSFKRNTTAKKPEPKTPTYHAYMVREGKGQKGFWTKIGAFFAHEDDEGGTLLLEAFPIDGKIVLRSPRQGDADPA